jgi:hypothetical protein
MFKEGNRECIDVLLKPSRSVLDTGVPIRNETFEKRQQLWNEIRANAERYKKGECGTFLKDLNTVFLARFDASLLLLALAFRQNNEQFEGSGYFSTREIEAYETIEKFSYFRILTKSDIAKKIRSKDDKTLTLLKEYAVSMKQHMDEILGDAGVRDTIRSYLKKQWDENTKKIGEAISSAGVDLDWFSSLPLTAKDAAGPQQIIYNINTGNDAAINLGAGNIVKDAVVTGSTIESSGSGGTTVKDSVVTKSTIKNEGTGGSDRGISISDSVITSSTIKNVQERPAEPEKEPVKEPPPQPPRYMCLLCKTTTKPGAKFCTTCGAKNSMVCGSCSTPLEPNAKFCPQCGRKTS